MGNIGMELTTLESERKMSALALKGHQRKLADQLRGEMGRDIRKHTEPSFIDRVWRSIDKFLSLFTNGKRV